MTELQEIFKVKQLFEKFDWFECIDIVNNNFIVYVNRMGSEVFNKVPDYINKRKVLIHFYISKMADKNVYTTSCYDVFSKNLEIQQFVKKNIHTYGKTVVGYVFYKIYNSNVEENTSIKYPDLYEEMNILCNKHGYLSIFKELELQGVV